MSAARFLIQKNFCRLFCDYGSSKRWRILGIETSCDDTGVAIVDSDKNILGEVKCSQSETHAMHGGILPHFAQKLHEDNIRKTVSEAVEKSGLSIKNMDAVAVTVKPGIQSCLSVGIEYAKDLCSLYTKPLIPIHHMEAHALTGRLMKDIDFPFLVLLVSGGHCILALAESVTKFLVLGETVDISPGVFFDKAARRLNLRNLREYTLLQGGVAIEDAAKKGNPFVLNLNFQSNRIRDCNFTFSGFYTIVMKFINNEEERLNIIANGLLPQVYDICANLQFSVFKYICERLENGMRYLDTKKMIGQEKRVLVVSGGVASNEYFRKMIKYVCDAYQYELVIPPKNLCTDNGVMIAWNGIERLKGNIPTVPPDELHSVQLSARCPLGENVSNDVISYVGKKRYLKLLHLMRKEMERESVELVTKSASEESLII